MKLIRTAASTVLLTLATLVSNGTLAIAAPTAVEDIRDIRAPLPIPPWWHWPLAIALALLAATAIGLFLRYWYKRRHRPLTPLERARQDLDLAEKLARMSRPHDWAEMVAATMRGALAVRIGENVLPQTTNELAKAPWAKVLVAGEPDAVRDPGTRYLLEAPQLLALLEICDLARFARANLDMDAMLVATSSARELLERLFAPQAQPNPEPAVETTPPPDPKPVPITLRTGAQPNKPPQNIEQVSP